MSILLVLDWGMWHEPQEAVCSDCHSPSVSSAMACGCEVAL